MDGVGLGPAWEAPHKSSDLLPFLRREVSVSLGGNFHVWAFGQTFAKKLCPHGPPALGLPSGWFMGYGCPSYLPSVLGSPRLLPLASSGGWEVGVSGTDDGPLEAWACRALPLVLSAHLGLVTQRRPPRLHSFFLHKILFASAGGLVGQGHWCQDALRCPARAPPQACW